MTPTASRFFAPLPEASFDEAAARHLLRRAGFGAPRRETKDAVERGLLATIEALALGTDAPSDLDPAAIAVAQGDAAGAAALWISAMSNPCDDGGVPRLRGARQKLAIFWHGHFATSNAKVDEPGLMLQQIGTFEVHGAGKFRDLLGRVARDPAMLLWLDAEKNRRGKPNENFARELFELFTLGIGHYTEKDIQEAARAFTGFRRAGQRFEFVPELHDDGEKTVLGTTGKLAGDDVIAIAAAHPATAQRLAYKLLRFYATPQPADEAVSEFAAVLRESDLAVGESLGVLFGSAWFHRAEHRGARIASPLEFVLAPLFTLEAQIKPAAVESAVSSLGQSLLRPPTVKGWDGEEAWIQTATELKRVAVAQRIARGELGALWQGEASEAGPDDVDDVYAVANRLLSVPLDPAVAAAVRSAVKVREPDDRPRALLSLLLSLPEASLT